MRINKLNIPQELSLQTNGIQGINLSKLGQVVALVGKNGSGKSRILDLLLNPLTRKLNLFSILKEDISIAPLKINDTLINDMQLLHYIKQKNRKLNPPDEPFVIKVYTPEKAVELNAKYTLFENEVTKILHSFSKSILKINIEDIKILESVIPPNTTTFDSLLENTQSTDNAFISIKKSALEHLAKLPHELLFEWDECFGDDKIFHNTTAYKKFINLGKKVETFLGKSLMWEKKDSKKIVTASGVNSEKKGIWKLDNREFNYQELSEGEKILFVYALLFYLLEFNTKIPIKDCIIVIDEPEVHLHPDSEIKLIEAIRTMIGNSGQLWIATHSLNIISSLTYEEIFIVKKGAVIDKQSMSPTDAIQELLDLDSNFERIKHFFLSIDQWAYSNFAMQCFKDPETISTTSLQDPQFIAFKDALKNNNEITLLDFGAGSGRIYKAIQETPSLKDKIKYKALEIDPQAVKELVGIGVKDVILSYDNLGENKYDAILMTNVLHEIKLSSWENTLNILLDSLKENGFLIILEDLELPKGEQIDEAGFLILAKEELGLLFGLGKNAIAIDIEEIKYRDRISCCIIPKIEAQKVTRESIIQALEKLEENSFSKYFKYKSKKTTSTKEQYKLGRKLALYSQLNLNSKSGLKLLKDNFLMLTELSEEQSN